MMKTSDVCDGILGSHTLVLIRDDDCIVDDQKGVLFLYNAVKEGRTYPGYDAYDTIIGKAAALLYVGLGVKSLYGRVMSDDAITVLEAQGISYCYQTKVPHILNRRKTAIGPFETALQDVCTLKDAMPRLETVLRQIGLLKESFMENTIQSYSIGTLRVPNRYALASLEGYGDQSLRELAFGYGAGLCFTEPVDCLALLDQDKRQLSRLEETHKDKERFPEAVLVLTLRAQARDDLMEAFAMVESMAGYDALYVLDDTEDDYAAMIRELSSFSRKPVIAKLKEGDSLLSQAEVLEEAGAQALVIRTDEASLIRKLKKKTRLPLLWQKDIPEADVLETLSDSDASAMVFSDMAIGYPILFRDLLCLETGEHKVRNGLIRQGEDLRHFIELEFGNHDAEHAIEYSKRQFGEFVKAFVHTEDVNEVIKDYTELDQFIETACELEYK